MCNKTENGSINKYKYLKVIDSEELNSNPEMSSTILALLFELRCNQLKDSNNDYLIISINDTHSSMPNKKAGVSEVPASDTPMGRAVGKPRSTVLLAYNKNTQTKSCYDKLKAVLQKSEFTL